MPPPLSGGDGRHRSCLGIDCRCNCQTLSNDYAAVITLRSHTVEDSEDADNGEIRPAATRAGSLSTAQMTPSQERSIPWGARLSHSGDTRMFVAILHSAWRFSVSAVAALSDIFQLSGLSVWGDGLNPIVIEKGAFRYLPRVVSLTNLYRVVQSPPTSP